MITTKVIMVMLLFGVTVDDKTVSKVKALNLYPTMEQCMVYKPMFRGALLTNLRKADWLTNGGRVKIKSARISCMKVDHLKEKEIPAT